MIKKIRKQTIKNFITNYKFGYINTIFLIIITTFAFYMLLDNTKKNSRKLNIAGKQRVLSQRSLFLLKTITESNDESTKRLNIQILANELNTFKKHQKLISKNETGPFFDSPLKINDMDQNNIDTYIFKIESYLEHLIRGQESKTKREFSKFAEFVFSSLYESLDRIVSKLESKDTYRYSILVKVLFLLMFTRVILLTIELKFIYKPLNKNLKLKNDKLRVASSKLYKESKLIRSAKHIVIKNNNIDISNALNKKLRNLTYLFFKRLKSDLFFNQLDRTTLKNFQNLLELHNDFDNLIGLRGNITLRPYTLNKKLKEFFKENEIEIKYNHQTSIKGNKYLLEILFSEIKTLLNTKESKLKVEHLNNQICLTLIQSEELELIISDQKMKKLEFLILKNNGKLRVDKNGLKVYFDIDIAIDRTNYNPPKAYCS